MLKLPTHTQVLAGDTTNKMAFLGGEEGAALCIALLCTIVLRRRLSSKKRSIWLVNGFEGDDGMYFYEVY
jgi:hypothetical protein